MLWRPEIQNILEKNHLPRYKQKSKKFVQQIIIDKVEWKRLKLQMCEEMFERVLNFKFAQNLKPLYNPYKSRIVYFENSFLRESLIWLHV